MTSENTDPKQDSSARAIYRFLGGTALGTFLVIIPISYGSSIDLNPVQMGIALLLTLSCGILSSIWGEDFVTAVTRVLDSFTF